MRRTKNIQGKCQHCGMQLEFTAEAIGSVAPCPYCHQQTELTLTVPELEPAISRRLVVWTVVTIVILLLGLAGAFIALNRARDLATKKPAPAPVPAQAEPTR